MSAGRGRTRVALVCEAAGGGVGKHVLDVAEQLPRLGFEVLVVHSTRRAEPEFAERLSRHVEFGYEVARVDVERAPGAGDILGALRLRRAVRAFGGADVMHGHSAKGGALARLARWRCARRVFYTPHAFYAQAPGLSPSARRLYGAAEYGLSLVTDRVIATSREELALAAALGIPRHKLTVVENGIELRTNDELARARVHARRALGIDPDAVVVGFVGRLAAQKAPVLAVETFRRLHFAHPSLHFVLAGDGPEAPAVSRALDAAGLAERVHWLTRSRGRDVVPAMDVLLVTSRYEGFPYVMLEALDAGCTIVTSPVGGASDCVISGHNGAIVECPSAGDLALAVRHFIEQPWRLSAARGVSRTLARRFELARMVERLAALYRSDTRDAA